MTTSDDLRRLAAESRLRLAALMRLQEQQRLITSRSHRCLQASRLLLAGGGADVTADGAVAAADRTRPAHQV